MQVKKTLALQIFLCYKKNKKINLGGSGLYN